LFTPVSFPLCVHLLQNYCLILLGQNEMTTATATIGVLIFWMFVALGLSAYFNRKYYHVLTERNRSYARYNKARNAIQDQAIEVSKLQQEAEKLEEWNRILNDENKRLKDVAGDPYRQGRADLWKEIQDTFGDVLDDEIQE